MITYISETQINFTSEFKVKVANCKTKYDAGVRYDAVFGVNVHNKLSDYKKVLSVNGKYIAVGNMIQFMSEFMLGSLFSLFSNKKITGSTLFLVNKSAV